MRVSRWWVVPAVLILAGCASVPASIEPSASAISTPSARLTASPFATSSASPRTVDLTDQLVAVVTDDLVVRSRPGTGSDSEIYPARLNAPTVVYIIDGPEAADGYEWYLVDPVTEPCYFGCDLGPQPGWVAAAGQDGERWLGEKPENPACPDPTLSDISAGYPQLSLYCFGTDQLTLDGGVVGVDSTHAYPVWPWKYLTVLYGPDYDGPAPGCVDLCDVPLLTIALDGDQELPPPLSTPRFSGHYDDPQADECRSAGIVVDQRILTHECRMVFVATSWD